MAKSVSIGTDDAQLFPNIKLSSFSEECPKKNVGENRDRKSVDSVTEKRWRRRGRCGAGDAGPVHLENIAADRLSKNSVKQVLLQQLFYRFTLV